MASCAGTIEPAAYLRAAQRAERCVRAEAQLPTIEAWTLTAADEELFDAAPPDVGRVLRAARLPLASEPDPAVLNARLLVLKSEISAAQGYVDCLGDSIANEIRQQVLERRSQSELRLTLASIITGAAAAIAAGIVELYNPEARAVPILGISGGVASAGLGAAALMLPAPRVRLEHRTNVLRAVWRDEAHGGLPSFAWRLLALPFPEARSPRESLGDQWEVMLADFPEDRRRELEALLFGVGGEYDIEALQLREAMLEQLETEIDLMNQWFHRLSEFIERRAASERDASAAMGRWPGRRPYPRLYGPK